MELYEARVEDLVGKGIYPDTKELLGGDIILKCWTRVYSNVNIILGDCNTQLDIRLSESGRITPTIWS